MGIRIQHYEPLRIPAPLTSQHAEQERRRIKQLGITPSIDNGIRCWRVIWRPFLETPIPYTAPDGRVSLRYKSNKVKTERFAIVGDATEEEAFQEAALTAAAAYRMQVAKTVPRVDWEKMAAAKGLKIRDRYAKPILNGGLDRARELVKKNLGLQQMADELGISKATACRWRKKLAKEKALHVSEAPNGS